MGEAFYQYANMLNSPVNRIAENSACFLRPKETDLIRSSLEFFGHPWTGGPSGPHFCQPSLWNKTRTSINTMTVIFWSYSSLLFCFLPGGIEETIVISRRRRKNIVQNIQNIQGRPETIIFMDQKLHVHVSSMHEMFLLNVLMILQKS